MNLSSENADVIRQVAEQSPAEQLEITLFSKNYGLTRFAGNQIHQNMAEEDTYVSVRVFHKARLGSCSTNRCDKASIRKSVEKAMGIAALNDPVNDFPGFAPPAETAELKECTYSSATAETDTNARGDIVDSILSDVQQNGFEAAGAVENGVYEKAVSTSCGQHVYQQETSAKLNLVVNRPGQAGVGTGLARWLGRDISELDCLSKAGQAVEISALNTNQVALDPGEYRVILTPEAVGLLLYYLSWMGFHSRAFHSGQSFMAGHVGEQILDSKLTIWDDGLDCSSFAMPFDWEGRPKKRVDFIENGKAGDVVYDAATAAAVGKASTGHALSLVRDRYYSSPLPTNLFIGPGNESVEEMIASSERAILINSFWYVREVHWGKATVTGMTRDGTFLVENGKIAKALPNLRFTQSIVETLKKVISIGKEVSLTEQYNGVAKVPALKLAKFNIVGSS